MPRVRFTYPDHLLQSARALPDAAGVYTFHGEEGQLPLYIGKSVSLRARVLAHLRNRAEARMLRQARQVSFVRTAGDLGALLLEAQLIKTQHPLFNKKLRRTLALHVIRVVKGRPHVVLATEADFAPGAEVYGLYRSPLSAREALFELADTHGLCLGALGLERAAPGRPCFRHMVKKCRGLCCGQDSADAHHDRLMGALEALRVVTWPFGGSIGLVEQSADLRQIHVVRNWCYLGSTSDESEARQLAQCTPGFDADGYRLLLRPVLTGTLEQIGLG